MKVVFHLMMAVLFLGTILSTSTFASPYDSMDLLYSGPYEVKLKKSKETLSCREKPDVHSLKKTEFHNKMLIHAKKVVFVGSKKEPWFWVEQGCYVRAHEKYLLWRGEGEDPSSMCDPRDPEEPCYNDSVTDTLKK